MATFRFSAPKLLIAGSILAFIGLMAAVFFLTYKFGQTTTSDSRQQIIETNRQGDDYQQVRRVKLTHKLTGESMEIYMDGTVKYYDKSGNLIKTGRRGFAETQNIFKRYEWLINNKRNLNGGDYYVEIETQTGIVTPEPGDGDGDDDGDLIDDTVDFVDDTINPTPTPTASPRPSTSPTPTSNPLPSTSPTPLPEKPDYLNAPPFDCSDYYQTGGRPLKISDIYCGIE